MVYLTKTLFFTCFCQIACENWHRVIVILARYIHFLIAIDIKYTFVRQFSKFLVVFFLVFYEPLAEKLKNPKTIDGYIWL